MADSDFAPSSPTLREEPSSPESQTSSSFGSGRASTAPTVITAGSDTHHLLGDDRGDNSHGHNNNDVEIPAAPPTLLSLLGIDRGPPKVDGWPRLARLMAHYPSVEAFARYEELNVKNILYLQVELAVIRDQLGALEAADSDPKRKRDERGKRYSTFHKYASNMVGTDTAQWRKIKELRGCLNEYNNALLQYSQVSALAGPTDHNMQQLAKWMCGTDTGNNKISGKGSKEIWKPYREPEKLRTSGQFTKLIKSIFVRQHTDPVIRPDLVAPRALGSLDGLTRWIEEDWIPFWDAMRKAPEPVGKDTEAAPTSISKGEKPPGPIPSKPPEDPDVGSVGGYKGATLQKISGVITTLSACALPIAAIFVLSVIHNLFHRLSAIAAFTLVFASLLMALTECTRIQVFTATSAFLAVLVVFIPVGTD